MNYDRIILELLSRVEELESDVAAIKSSVSIRRSAGPAGMVGVVQKRSPGTIRDHTKYLFEGRMYGKGRLVLAVVQRYAADHPGITGTDLVAAFDKSLQGSLGVVRKVEDAVREYIDANRRFYMALGEPIETPEGNYVVCSQWGAFNISSFITRAVQLGFDITTVH